MHVCELEKAMAGTTEIFLFININRKFDWDVAHWQTISQYAWISSLMMSTTKMEQINKWEVKYEEDRIQIAETIQKQLFVLLNLCDYTV